jgi:predicted nucleic acid-binding protein
VARERLYLETSVWNFLFADDAPEKQLVTKEFFALCPSRPWSLIVSQIVIDEIMDTPDVEHRARLLDAVHRQVPEFVDVSDEALELAEKYILQGTLSRRQEQDARHAAAAVVAECDVIVSWNLRHLVKLKTRREINAANMLNGYRMIEIVTPEELI